MDIHFVNVGKGNCSIIDFPTREHLTIVDIDNSRHTEGNELTCPIDYLEEHFKGRSIHRFILTHPDMDHMSGLHELHSKYSISNFWDTENDKTLTMAAIKKSPFYSEDDWKTYKKISESQSKPKALKVLRKESRDFWNVNNITVLSPSSHLIKLSKDCADTHPDKYNHLSYVLRIDYAGVRILFGGDATVAAWDNILAECGKESLKADIFLAPHHGSKNNVNEEVFKHIAPDYVIVSVDQGVDYDYKYYTSLAKRRVLSTKHYGNIELSIKEDGSYLPFKVERNSES
jgi:competence protein ComEC